MTQNKYHYHSKNINNLLISVYASFQGKCEAKQGFCFLLLGIFAY